MSDGETADPLVRVGRSQFTAAAVRRAGLAAQGVGVLGAGAWILLTYLAWDRTTGPPGGPRPDWSIQALALLSPLGTLLLAALLIAVGALCRLLADWSLAQADDRHRLSDRGGGDRAAQQ